MDVDLDRRRVRALRYLSKGQREDGSFNSLSSPRVSDFVGAKEHYTVLVQAVILRALAEVELPGADVVRGRLADFLVEQRSETGSFNYWVRSTQRYKNQPYPDDLDDTACAWLALAKSRPQSLDATALAKLTRLLVATEQKPGGPYRTWLVGPEADAVWQDVDLAVNANIWTLLRQLDVRLPDLEAWLVKAVHGGRESAYYPGWLAPIYFLSEKSEGELRNALSARLEVELGSGQLRSGLEAALLVASGMWLGVDRKLVEPLVDRLARTQNSNGSWAAYGFCLDPAKEGQSFYAGSSYLTTALAVQALTLWMSSGKAVVADRLVATVGQSAPVWPAVKRRLGRLPDSVQAVADPVVAKVLRMDSSHGVTSLAAHILRQVPPNKGHVVQGVGLRRNQLVQGSLYGWLAYTAADDVIDGDAGSELLPLIQSWTGQMRSYFWQASSDMEYQGWVDRRLQAMDLANLWELHHARFSGKRLQKEQLPQYGTGRVVIDRAGGNLVAPIGALIVLGYRQTDPPARALVAILRHIMMARQLHDDAHDWSDDLSRGQINMVAARLLARAFEDIGRRGLDVSSRATQDRLRRLFWQEVVVDVLKDIDRHLKTASRQLQSRPELVGLNEVEGMIERLQRSTEQTRHQRTEALRFWEQFTAGSAAGR